MTAVRRSLLLQLILLIYETLSYKNYFILSFLSYTNQLLIFIDEMYLVLSEIN